MSEFREDLLASSVDKKRVIKTILLVGALITLFAFSTVIFSLIWGSLRIPPNDQFSQAEWEDAELIDIPLTINFSDFQDLFDNLTLDPDQIEDALDALQDMFDGNIDDLDLSDFAAALLGLAASNIEVFRIYNDEDFDFNLSDFFDTLWKYECFDEYNGSGWLSTAGKQIHNFYTYADYFSNPPLEDILKVQMPLSPSAGQNSMVIPTLFPNPYVMEGSLSAMNNMSIETLDIDQTELYKDDFNSTTLDPYFMNNDPVNLTYKMFGLDLPTEQEISMSAVNAIYTPAGIRNKYIRLPPSINVYRLNNPNFNTQYNLLNQTISTDDNAFQVADKIKSYIQTRFTYNYNPAPSGRDAIDWFCETGSGMPSDFASAFCAFTRSFGVASRFITGFNSLNITKEYDALKGQHYFSIKYRNLYNWAEVYIPTDTSGNGQWVQMEVFPVPSNYSLSLYSNFTAGNRGAVAEVTAHLKNNNIAEPNRIIYFYDEYYNQFIGQATTNLDGNATIYINIDDTQIVGPHMIVAYYGSATNYTSYMVHGDIEVNLTSVNPANVTIPQYTNTFIQGYMSDPVNNERVRYATVELLLLEKDTNIRASPNPFVESPFIDTDDLGEFNINLNVDPSVNNGQYDFRADMNNTWNGIFYPLGNMYDSSNLIDFNVSRIPIKKLLFYINDVPADITDYPVVNRSASLNLKALVLNETNSPLANQNIEFRDYTRGTLIGTNTTNSNGIATLDYSLGSDNIAGPNLLFAKLNSLENHSYFVLNEEPIININLGPVPRSINRTVAGAINTLFHIVGNIEDRTNGLPIRFSELTLRLFRGTSDYSDGLLPAKHFWTDSNGNFDEYLEVNSTIPTGNYSLRLDFNGTIDFNWLAPYPYFFNLSNFNTSTSFENQIKVTTPSTLLFNFWINGTNSTQYQQPVISRNGDLNLSVYLQWGPDPILDGDVYFYDLTQDALIGSALITDGIAHLIYQTNGSTTAGPHLIYANYDNYYNHSYFILDDQVNLTLDTGPEPRWVYSSGSTNRNFNLEGSIIDANNSNPVKYAQISVRMYDGLIDVSHFLNLESGNFNLDETGEYYLTFSVSSAAPAKNYTLTVEFYGTFLYSNPNNFFNEYNFNLHTFPNLNSVVNGLYQIKIINPDDINLNFFIDGKSTLPYYDDTNPPNRYNRVGSINLSIYLTQSGSPVNTGTVSFIDYYASDNLGEESVVNGHASILVNISSWHAGLHQVRVQWSGSATFNYTYIIINETITISPTPSSLSIQRDLDHFWVDTYVQDGTINLYGLRINLLLLNNNMNDASGYLNPQYSNIKIANGFYRFNIDSILLNCPEGQYFLRVDFNGSISEPGIFLNDYMVHTSSSLISINVTAGTYIVGNYDTTFKNGFYQGDELHAYGYLYWDNGSLITGSMSISITIKDGLGGIITTEIGTTDGSGWFNITIPIDSIWPDEAEVWVSFYPENSFPSPDHYYIEYIDIELFRP